MQFRELKIAINSKILKSTCFGTVLRLAESSRGGRSPSS